MRIIACGPRQIDTSSVVARKTATQRCYIVLQCRHDIVLDTTRRHIIHTSTAIEKRESQTKDREKTEGKGRKEKWEKEEKQKQNKSKYPPKQYYFMKK